MNLKISKYVKSELNKISFILKLSYYKRLLPEGRLMNMIDDAPVTWEDVTWVNINKGNPRAVGEKDLKEDSWFPNITTKGDYSVFDFDKDEHKRISFELIGKLTGSGLPIKIRVDREKGNDSYNYSLFIKGKSDFELISRPKNIPQFTKDLSQLNEFVNEFANNNNNNLEKIDFSDIKNKSAELLNAFSSLISKDKLIMPFILDTYEQREKEKPLYLFNIVPEKQLKDKFINLNFNIIEKDIKEDSKKRNSEYEKKIADILQEYINKELAEKIDLNNFIFDYKPGKLFGIKVKVKVK